MGKAFGVAEGPYRPTVSASDRTRLLAPLQLMVHAGNVHAARVRGRTTAIIYLVVGCVVTTVSVGLLLLLYFTQSFIYWYFLFGTVIGLVLVVYGLVMLARYCQLRRGRPLSAHDVQQANVEADFARSQVAMAAPVADFDKDDSPAPTAPPPPNFVQQHPDQMAVGEPEKSEFAFEPVAYEKKE